VVAGTEARPGCQVMDAEEHAHVHADLGNQDRGNDPIDARYLYGRNAKLVFSAILQVDAGDVGLYQRRKYRQSGRKSRKLSMI